MAENKKSVLLYCDIIHTVEALDDQEAGILFKHYLRYINDLNPDPPDKLTQIVFEPIKQNLKRDLKKWEQKSERNSNIAKAGWEKRKDANAYERIKTDAKHADKVKVKVKDKDIIINNKEVFNQFPKNENLDFLPEIKIDVCIQLLKITKQTDINKNQVEGMWAVFKNQNITGEKFYKSKDDIYSHFINWIKTQKFEDAKRITTFDKPAKLGTSAARIEVARKW